MNNKPIKIGVFDSGVGGLSIANAIKREYSDLEVVLREDKENLPYGTKTPELLYKLVLPIIESMEKEEGCDLIVIACNTVTTNIISELREAIKVPLIGIEPMVKPASVMTRSNRIAVYATPATLSSKRYAYLKNKYCKDVAVFEPDCSDWAEMIENNNVNVEKIKKIVDDSLEFGADVLVLGCTHYHWIEKTISKLSQDKATVIQPEQAVLQRLKSVIQQLD